MQNLRELNLEVLKLRDVIKNQDSTIAARESASVAQEGQMNILDRNRQDLERTLQEARSELAHKERTIASLEGAKKVMLL